MVMATISPQSIGREFVRQYYTMLHKDPTQMHRFYMKHSLFTHGSLQNYRPMEPIIGQEAIHAKIMQLGYSGCYSKIRSVDSQKTINGGVVVQVVGELSNRGMPMRKFTQTFVLKAESPKNYYVFNDIFRYQDEEIESEEQTDDNAELYSADEEEAKEEAKEEAIPPAAFDQQIGHIEAKTNPEKSNIIEEDISHYEPEPTAQATGLTNGSNLVEEENNACEGEANFANLQVAKPTEEIAEEEPVAAQYQEQEAEEEKEEQVAAEVEKIKPDEPVEPEGPAEPEGPPAPLTWASFVKKSTPTTPPQSNAPVSRTVTAKSPPQPAPMLAKPQQQKRREESTKKDNREETRKKFGIAPDSHQIFIGNLPNHISEADVRGIFKEYGNIIEVRLNAKNFGFVAFDAPEPAEKILKSEKPIMFGKSAINVEEKRSSASASRGTGQRRDFGRGRSDAANRGASGGGRPGQPSGNRDRPRGGSTGQQRQRGGMNSAGGASRGRDRSNGNTSNNKR
eukprot:gene7033-7822_t